MRRIAGTASVKDILKGTIPGTGLKFSKVVELGPRETKLVSLESKAIMKDPHLWWPLNYGRQYLYDLILQFILDGKVSDEQVYLMWRKHVKELDGTRFWIPSGFFPDSRKDVPEWFKEDMPTGMNDEGGNKSYGWKEPVSYFKWVREDRSWMFKIENGSASLPPISSLAKFLPDLGEQSTQGAPFPLTETWAHHGANSYYKESDNAIRRLHGEPESVADYCWKAHLITADQQRSFYEAVNHRLWDITSGFTQWKINSSYPDIQWQNFDYYFKPGVSHFYIKRACETVHVQLNLIDGMVSIINNRLAAQSGIKLSALVFDLKSKLLWEKTGSVDVPANSYKEAFRVPEPSNVSPVYFVKLEIKDSRDQLLSENFYWLRNKNTADYKSLQNLEPVRLSARFTLENMGDDIVAHVKLTNSSDKIAFFTQLALTRSDDNEVLPVIWDVNYFSMLPGESRKINARLAMEDVGPDKVKLEIGGWNIQTEYKCTNLKVLNEKIRAGEEFTVVAAISKTFLDGSRVWLLADGKPSVSNWAWARGDKIDEIKFKMSLPTQGKHELEIGQSKIKVVIE